MIPDIELTARKFVIIKGQFGNYPDPPEILYYVGDEKWSTITSEARKFDTRKEANEVYKELDEGLVCHAPLTWKEIAEYASTQDQNSAVFLMNDNDVMFPFVLNGQMICLRDDDYSENGL